MTREEIERLAADLKNGSWRNFEAMTAAEALLALADERDEWIGRAQHYQTATAELYDQLHGTPCANIRHKEELDAALAPMKALRVALERAERKLSAYVGVCKGDKELTGTVLPMARAALAASKDGLESDQKAS